MVVRETGESGGGGGGGKANKASLGFVPLKFTVSTSRLFFSHQVLGCARVLGKALVLSHLEVIFGSS